MTLDQMPIGKTAVHAHLLQVGAVEVGMFCNGTQLSLIHISAQAAPNADESILCRIAQCIQRLPDDWHGRILGKLSAKIMHMILGLSLIHIFRLVQPDSPAEW